MQTIQMLKDAEGYREGEVLSISNNDAHRLIFQGNAKLYSYPDKMMRPVRGKRKGYRVK